MNLLVSSSAASADEPCQLRVTPESAGWRYVGFEVHRLSGGAVASFSTEGRELCLVLLTGRADLSFAGREWPDVGRRAEVFDGPPYALQVPPGGTLTAAATTETTELALCWAPAKQGVEPVLITPEDVRVYTRGTGGTAREIRDVLMESRQAEALLVTEVVTPGGNWSSWPPHKHDTEDLPREAYLEETYYHRFQRAEGFGVQLLYTPDTSLDETLRVRDGDVVLVPRGYHPVSAAPGSDLWYLNVMAGPVRRWAVTIDPAHGDRL